MQNSLYLKYKNKIYLQAQEDKLPDVYIHNFLVNLESLGFTLSEELLGVISTFSIPAFEEFYIPFLAMLRAAVGAHVQHKPMYVNFPQEVQRLSQEELYTYAFMHYLGDYLGIRILPNLPQEQRQALKEEAQQLRIIGLGTIAEYEKIFSNLLSAKSALAVDQQEDIRTFVATYQGKVFSLVPVEIPIKENMAVFIAALLQHNIYTENSFFHKYIKTATDVLRIAVALCRGDVSLALKTKFISYTKAQRRFFLQILDHIEHITEDMLRYKEPWKRLGERLHPAAYQDKYPHTAKAFDVLRNDLPFTTYNSAVEKTIKQREILHTIALLKSRAGELARRLDQLLRLNLHTEEIIQAFQTSAQALATPVLLQLMAHFQHRAQPKDLRIFTPKGLAHKITAIANNLPPIRARICESIVQICQAALIERFKNYAPLGKVYLSQDFKNYTVPLSQRSASKALVTIPKGSKIPLPQGNTIRFFVYWKEDKIRVDIDLSVLALDTSFEYKTQIAYYHLNEFGAYHSGDITSAPQGASEFIDIDIAAFLKKNIRYVVMTLSSYTQQPYCDLPICFAGFMMRSAPNSGEIFEPRTLVNKFDLTTDEIFSIPLMLDLQERTIVWTDLSLSTQPNAHNNVHNNLSSLSLMAKAAIANWVKPNLYDLLQLHILARGESVEDIAQADTIFSKEKGIRPTDIDIFLAEYL